MGLIVGQDCTCVLWLGGIGGRLLFLTMLVARALVGQGNVAVRSTRLL